MKLSIVAVGLIIAAAGGSQLVAYQAGAESAVQSAPQDSESRLCDWLIRNDADSMVRLWFVCGQ